MENFWLLLLFATILALIISKTIRPKKKFPPGPKPWLIIGNLNLLGSLPHQSLHFLSQKYGELMQLKFGKYPVVVASSPEMAKQFLKTHDIVFASRPPLAVGKYTSYNYSDVGWAPYGPYYRHVRKIFLSEVFNAKRLEFFEEGRVEERRHLMSRLRDISGKPVMIRDHLSRYSLAIISRMVTGNKYFTTSKEEVELVKMDEVREMVDEWFYLSGVFNIGDWIPWLSFLDLQGYVKKMKALNKKMDKFLEYVIDDHLATKSTRKGIEPEDFVDVILDMADDPNLEVKLTRDRVKALIQNLLVAGTDTSSLVVEWALHELLSHPRIMKKAKEELDRVIGRNRWVEEKDFSQLPYIEAIITETLRLHPVSALLAPHYTMEDCKVAGYDISKGTTILINLWSIGRNSNSWDAPEEFLPERFENKEINLLGSNFALLPFGSGTRRCPGYKLGLKMVRTTLTNLLHGFELKLIEGMRPENVSMEEGYGLTTHPKHPISIIMEPTLPLHLY